MKALKEKRISLRSLWRRGLVILSLFALVFASCGDSSSGGGTDSGGPTVVKFTVKSQPTEDQYYGQLVDKTGITLDVFTSDGGRYTETDITKFEVTPRFVTGEYRWSADNSRYEFYADSVYRVIYKGGISAWSDSVKIKSSNVWWIYRSDTYSKVDEYPGAIPVAGSMDLGLHITGAAKLANEAYVDDDKFDLAGLTIEADYVKGYGKTQIVRKTISLSSVAWEIKPRYDADAFKAHGGYYDGYIYVTVGLDKDNPWIDNKAQIDDWLSSMQRWIGEVNDPWSPYYDTTSPYFGVSYSSWLAAELAWWGVTSVDEIYENMSNRGGITAMLPLEKVWTVRDIKAINLKVSDDVRKKLTTYFYWQPNTKDAWIGRLGDDAELEVTYTNNVTQTKSIKDLADKERIYWNSNPQGGKTDHWTEQGVYNGPRDFDIMSLKYPFTKKNADLGVILYYRGGQQKIDVDVYTTLVKVEADPSVDFWPNPDWDNDVDNGLGGPKELAKRLKVYATYQAINDAGKQEPYELSYYYGSTHSKYNGTDIYGAQPYYLFGELNARTDAEEAAIVEDAVSAGGTEEVTSTYAKGYQKYLTNLKKGKETTTNITIRHMMDVPSITAYYAEYFNDLYGWGIANTADEWADGLLPNAYLPYDPNVDNKQAAYFGPKVNQNKKTKVTVNWLSSDK